MRVHVSFGPSAGRRVRTPFTESFECYAGAAWPTLTRECVDYVADFCRRRPDVVQHYHGVLSPEESFVHTVLLNAQRFAIIDDHNRFVDFRRSEFNHPKVLTSADLPEALASGANFGRSSTCTLTPAVLDELDRVVLGQHM